MNLLNYFRSVFASFGGLLVLLQGDPRYLPGIELDARIYLLIKKA